MSKVADIGVLRRKNWRGAVFNRDFGVCANPECRCDTERLRHSLLWFEEIQAAMGMILAATHIQQFEHHAATNSRPALD